MNTKSLSIVLTAAFLSCFFAQLPRAFASDLASLVHLAAASKLPVVCIDDKTSPACQKAKQQDLLNTVNAECKEKEKEFSAATTAFNSACATAGTILNSMPRALNITDPELTKQSCKANIIRCRNCAGGANARFGSIDYQCGKLDFDENADFKPSGSSLTNTLNGIFGAFTNTSIAPTTPEALRESRASMVEEIQQCVPQKAEELTDLRTTLKDTRTDLRAMEEKVRDKNSAILEAQQEATDKENAANDRADEIKSKTTEAINAIKSRLDNRLQEVTSTWTTNNMKIEDDIRRIRHSKRQAENIYTESILQLDRGCHANALARVEAERKERLELAKQNALSSGNFKNVMSGVGKSERKFFQERASQYYNDCRDDRAYKSVVESSVRAKQQSLDTADDEIAALQNRQALARAEIDKFKTSEATNALNEIKSLDSKMREALAALERQTNNNATKARQIMFQKNQELNALNRQVGELKSEYDDSNDRMRLIRTLAGGATPGKEGSVNAAIMAFDKAEEAAKSVQTICCNVSEAAGNQNNPFAQTACTNAKRFLNINENNTDTNEPSAPAARAVGEGASAPKKK